MLKNDVMEIRSALQAGKFPNEAAVCQGVVLRLLSALGWPTYNTEVVSPEYALEGRRVDFALCHPLGKPILFIEVKQVGRSDGGERQLFEYAFHKGVPLAVLTDGREWHFFLPGEQGDYGERRVYKLDIVEREPAESVRRFERYLKYEAVCSGAALGAARSDYQDVARERQFLAKLPEAWTKLVEEEDELLLELLADRVESLCGYKPDPDTVARFLSEDVVLRTIPPPPSVAAPPKRPEPITIPPIRHPAPATFGFSLSGELRNARNARDVLVCVIEALAERDSTFLDRFASLPIHGRTRRYIARDPNALYPGRPDLAQEFSHQLRSGWWLGINISRRQVERIIKMACEVAGLRYGKDLTITLGS